MKSYQITNKQIERYCTALKAEERSPGTIEKYRRDIQNFAVWLDSKPVAKETVTAWKAYLLNEGYAPTTINSMLSSINGFCRFMGWEDCRVKFLRIQKRVFREESRDMTRSDYQKLLDAAHELGRDRLWLLMETICATGIRVSEVKYITVEATQRGVAEISLKGKIRTILLPSKLQKKLLKYAKRQKIASGEIFLTKSGKGLSRRQIWREMKQLCAHAGVEASKVFPHNLRHLFATTFYRASRDIVKLADILGHSSIDTTRIYLLTTGMEHIKQLEGLGLVS